MLLGDVPAASTEHYARSMMAYLSDKVRDHRFERLRDSMRLERVDAIGISDPDYFFFLTNYTLDVRTWERPVLLIVPVEGEPFAFMHELSKNGVAMARSRGTLWLDDVRYYAEHPRISERLPLRPALVHEISRELRHRGMAGSVIGYDSPPVEADTLKRNLPGLELVDANHMLRPLRWVKTSEELTLARRVAKITDRGQEFYRNRLKAGQFIQEVDAIVIAEVTAEACVEFAGEDFSMRLHSWRGPESAAPHGGPRTGTRIEPGDGVVNILTARLNGIEVENERTWFVGQPNDEQVRCFEATRAANAAAAKKAVEGNQVCELDEAAQVVYEDAGLGTHIVHRTGHGMGIERHEFPEDMAFCTRRLLRNEMYSIEPGIYVPGLGGFRHDNTVIVGAGQPEIITQAPVDLESQIVG